MTTTSDSTCADAFVACCKAIQRPVLIQRVSRSDKEFHFQNWVSARLDEASLQHYCAGRNRYPDFTLVHHAEGYEVKGLQWPGREASYDSNSQVPTGVHNGRTIYYVFGRYPSHTDDMEYPVIDLVLCHGDFLNANHTYAHKNKSFRGFGSYGDLLVRDRKMYVAPTPFALTNGTTGQATLIVPEKAMLNGRLEKVGELTRTETTLIVIGYSFDLRDNKLTPQLAPNPSAGREHRFCAYRQANMGSGTVTMESADQVSKQMPGEDQ
ncbi:MAG: hypothetical protein ACRDYA_16445 [Egibacteraceae bacterium]